MEYRHDLTDHPHSVDTNINATISQDRSSGATAAEDAGFGMLAQETYPAGIHEQHLPPYVQLTPGHGLDGQPGGSSYALRDYQMQLMILEQQNKKRLMLARQEQDGKDCAPDGPPHPLPSSSNRVRTKEEEENRDEGGEEETGHKQENEHEQEQGEEEMYERHTQEQAQPTPQFDIQQAGHFEQMHLCNGINPSSLNPKQLVQSQQDAQAHMAKHMSDAHGQTGQGPYGSVSPMASNSSVGVQQMIFQNGINPHELTPEQLMNSQQQSREIQQKIIATYATNLQHHHHQQAEAAAASLDRYTHVHGVLPHPQASQLQSATENLYDSGIRSPRELAGFQLPVASFSRADDGSNESSGDAGIVHDATQPPCNQGLNARDTSYTRMAECREQQLAFSQDRQLYTQNLSQKGSTATSETAARVEGAQQRMMLALSHYQRKEQTQDASIIPLVATQATTGASDTVSKPPKRGRSAYMFFANVQRANIREENPRIPFGQVDKILGERWKALDEKSRASYKAMAAANGQRCIKNSDCGQADCADSACEHITKKRSWDLSQSNQTADVRPGFSQRGHESEIEADPEAHGPGREKRSRVVPIMPRSSLDQEMHDDSPHTVRGFETGSVSVNENDDDTGSNIGIGGSRATVQTPNSADDEDMNQEFCILHRVHCSHNPRSIYKDVPVQKQKKKGKRSAKRGHLAGDEIVLDIAAFAATKPELSFVAFKDYYCPRCRETTVEASENKEIKIVSKNLETAIKQVSKCLPENETNHYRYMATHRGDGTYPPVFFYHHKAALQSFSANHIYRTDVVALLHYIERLSSFANHWRACDAQLATQEVSAETLSWLFCPNELVVATSQGSNPSAYVLENWPRMEANKLLLDCWSWGYDGQVLRRRRKTLTVTPPSHGTVAIDSLAVYPERFTRARTTQCILEAGKKFWRYKLQSFQSYTGWDWLKERNYPASSRCMIDYQTYRKFHPQAEAFTFDYRPKAQYDPWPQTIANTEELSKGSMMLLPRDIHGFFLKEKKWVRLHVDNVRPVTWNKEAFDRIVLPDTTKTLVRSMVMSRARSDGGSETQTNDIISGKGNGLIMLLHGPPGTGKSLTAESVAELAEMPLYSVTCGDIGTKPDAVEKYLNTVLQLGKTWNAVLLLDEADVFLEKRSISDLDRNSLVSVFLRILEYYTGIIVLTSNRVESFDAAFKSRIQVALSYPHLDSEARGQIWENFISMTDAENADIDDIMHHFEELQAVELNGRQIRNSMATAKQLARYLGQPLSWSHLQTAITTASDFGNGKGFTD